MRSQRKSSHTYNLEQAQAIASDVIASDVIASDVIARDVIASDVIDRFHGACGDLKDHFAALADAQRSVPPTCPGHQGATACPKRR